MFNSPILEVAIVMAFLYLLGSQVVLSIYELWAGYRNVRGKFLYRHLEGTLGVETTQHLYAQKSIVALSPADQPPPTIASRSTLAWFLGKDGIPAYISPDLFASTLLGMVSPTATSTSNPVVQFKCDLIAASNAISSYKITLDKARENADKANQDLAAAQAVKVAAAEAVKAMEATKPAINNETIVLLQQLLQAPAFSSVPPAPLATFQQTLAMWYDTYGERLTGQYKRRTRLWLLLIGFVVAIGANVDTPHIVQHIWHHPALRSSLMEAAVQQTGQAPSPASPTSEAAMTGPAAASTAASSRTAAASTASTSAPTVSSREKAQASVQAVSKLTLQLRKTGFPVGRADTLAAPADSAHLDSPFYVFYPAEEVQAPLEGKPSVSARKLIPARYRRYMRQESSAFDSATKYTVKWTWWKKDWLPATKKTKALLTETNNRTPTHLQEIAEAPFLPSLDSIGRWLNPQPQSWLLTWLGYLLTAVALSVGAPFWFELLNRFINIRNQGLKPPPPAK